MKDRVLQGGGVRVFVIHNRPEAFSCANTSGPPIVSGSAVHAATDLPRNATTPKRHAAAPHL